MINLTHPVALTVLTILVFPGVTTFVIATYKMRDVFSMSEVGHTYFSGVLVLAATYSYWSPSPHFLFYASLLSFISTDIVDTIIVNRGKLASAAYEGMRAYLLVKFKINDLDKDQNDTANK